MWTALCLRPKQYIAQAGRSDREDERNETERNENGHLRVGGWEGKGGVAGAVSAMFHSLVKMFEKEGTLDAIPSVNK